MAQFQNCHLLGKTQFFHFLNDSSYSGFYYFDDIEFSKKKKNILKFNDYLLKDFEDTAFFVSLGYKNLKAKHHILSDLKNKNRLIPTFFHHTSFINKSACIESGAFIYPMCNIDKNVIIKMGTLLNNNVVISHDSIIGNCCYLSPGVIVSGNVTIGDYTFVGSGSVISNNIKIGNNVVVGIGTVVSKDIPDNTTVIGNPMKIINHQLNII